MKNYNQIFENIAQTKTPEFKKWFGRSKVVDKSGNPLVVYHGTRSNFSIFRPSKKQGNQGEKDQLEGMYFTDSFEGASFFALSDDDRFLKKVYLSIKNPYKVKTMKT